MNRPVIFLDVDGVINTPRTWGKRRENGMQPELVAKVERICWETGAAVVISSTWRKSYEFSELVGFLRVNGLTAKVLGVTPFIVIRGVHQPRQDEILAWRQENGHVGPYAILDDDTACDNAWDKVLEHWIDVDPETGLTDDNVATAIEMLSE